jgi:hypothetical protein
MRHGQDLRKYQLLVGIMAFKVNKLTTLSVTATNVKKLEILSTSNEYVD